MLRLSETNCDSKGHNLTLTLRDRRALLLGQEVALMTVLGFAGVVGLTCVGLVIFNWKLQQGRANEHTSKNLCCRTLNESLCAHEERNGCAVGYSNGHLTQENETEVMSCVGFRKEIPLRQENNHQAMLASTSTALDASFRKLKGRDHGPDSACSSLNDALLPERCLGSPGTKKALYDASLVTRCPKTAEKLSNLKHGKVQSQILPQHGTRKIDVNSNTFRSRYVTSASALARESLGKHLTDKSWQPPIGKEDNAAQPHRQRLFITRSSSKPWETEQCAMGRISHRRKMGYDDHHGLLKQNKPMDFHSNSSFTCKYVSWDEIQNYMKEKKSKSEKEQIQVNRAIEKFIKSRGNKDKPKLSAKIKKSYSTKRVKAHDHDLVRGNRLVVSAETPASRKQLESESHYPMTSLHLKNCTNLEEAKESKEWFPKQWVMKKKRPKKSHPSKKAKGQNLRIKLGLYPFGKARVYPEESLQKLPKRHKQTGILPKKTTRTSEKKSKAAPMSFVRSSCAKPTCSKVQLKSAPRQTPCQERNGFPRTDSLSVGNLGSVQRGYFAVSHVSNGSSSTVPQCIASVTEHQSSQPLFLPVQMKNATQLQTEAMGPFTAHVGNAENSVLLSQHARGAIDHVVMVSTQYIDEDKLTSNELNQLTLSFNDQVTDTFSRDHSLGNNQALHQEEQKLSHKQLGSEEKPLVNKSKISHQSVESCIIDGEGIDGKNKIPCIEDDDSSPLAWIQPHSNVPLMMPQSTPHLQRTELLKEISSSPTRSHALGHLLNSSKDKTDRESPSLGDSHGEAPGAQAGVEGQTQAVHERKAHPGAVSWTTQVATTDERQQPSEGEGKEKHFLCQPGSIKDSSKVKTSVLQSEADPHTLKHTSQSGDPGNRQPDVSAHRGNAGTVGMPGASYLSWEPNITHSQAENRVSLIPNTGNETGNPA